METNTKNLRQEAQIKSSESLSECQLPLGQRLLCVFVAGVCGLIRITEPVLSESYK
uniref:Uncharacterized protein n=1 Tax=Cyprinodon variegatus TaxID=28743 RepID=A0A3Q2FS57_CYPVA